MVQQWKWLLLWGHFLLGSSRAVCQGLGRRSPGEMQRQLWPPVRPVGSLAGGGGALPAQRTRLSQAAFGATPAQDPELQMLYSEVRRQRKAKEKKKKKSKKKGKKEKDAQLRHDLADL
eukprot:g20864.t1